MDQISDIARAGMTRAISKAVESADRITRAVSTSGVDEATAAILDLAAAERDFQASAKLVGVQRELDKRVLDLLA